MINTPQTSHKFPADYFRQMAAAERLLILIDLGLLIATVLMIFTQAAITVISFHLIFMLLTLGAFYWKFYPFVIRAGFWVTTTTFLLLRAIADGHVHIEEIVEIPLLTVIFFLVFIIAGERAKAKEELERSEERYHTLFDNLFKESRDAIFITDQEGHIVDVNQALLDLFGYSKEEITGLDPNPLSILLLEWPKLRQKTGELKSIRDYEIKFSKKDGTEMDCLLTLSMWRAASEGSLLGYQGIIRNITHRKQAEEALRESEERYRHLVELSFEAVLVHSDGKFIHLNGPAARLLGAAKPEELIGKSVLDFVHLDHLHLVQVRIEQLQQRGSGVPLAEEKFIRLDGSSVDVEVAAVPAVYQGRQAVQVVVRDITERKRAEAERERLLITEREQRIQAEILGDVFLALTAQTSYETVLDEILRQVQRVVSYSAANIMTLQGDILRIARYQGYHIFSSREIIPNLSQSLPDFPLDAQVVLSRQPVVVPDTQQNPHWITTKESAWIRSFIAVPICLRDNVLGLLRLDSDTPERFSSHDLKRLLPLANAAAIALDNARLYDQARQEIADQTVQAEAEIIQLNQKLLTLQYASATIASSSRLQSILNTIPKEMASLLKVTGCDILKWDQATSTVSIIARYGFDESWAEEGVIVIFPLSDYSLMAHVLTERLPQQIAGNYPELYSAEVAYMKALNLKTLLLVPMQFQNRVVGLVTIMDDQAKRTFTNREIGLIQLLANQVASAIETNRLYDQIRAEIAERLQVEKELRQVAAKNQAILEAISDSMFYLSRKGNILDYKIISNNNMLPELLGEVSIGKNLSDLLPPDLVTLTLSYIEKALETYMMQIFEVVLPSSPASVVLPAGVPTERVGETGVAAEVLPTAEIALLPTGVATRYLEARLVVSGQNEVLAIIRDITERKAQEAALEKERLRIARDLHDSLGQSLGYLRLKLDGLILENAWNNIRTAQQDLRQMHDVANEAYELVRNMLAAARSANSTELGTILLAQAQAAGNRARFKVRLSTEGQPRPLLPVIQQQVLYIFKEALNNVEKHADAYQVNILLTWQEDKVMIVMSDDGVGFETDVLPRGDHFGLAIMRERAEEIKGNLSITSNLKSGTEVTLCLPYAFASSLVIA